MVPAETQEMENVEDPPSQTSTAKKTSTSCSPLSKEKSKEAPVAGEAVHQTGATETKTQTQTQGQNILSSVEPPDSATLQNQRHDALYMGRGRDRR